MLRISNIDLATMEHLLKGFLVELGFAKLARLILNS